MTAATVSRVVRRPFSLGDGLIGLAMALAATALTCLMNASQISDVWRGHLGDPDDAMRLVEARAWLAGQPWFDMTAARLDPPAGSLMHWSRLIDVPVASFVKMFGLFTDAATAERLAFVAVPTMWLVLLYVGVARLAMLLAGRAGRLPAMLGILFSGAVLVQFAPGRIGHHAPETVALVFAVGCAVAACDGRRVGEAFASGMLVALSLAMSLETLPFHVALIGVLVALWIWKGLEFARVLAWFTGGLLVGLPAFFLLTVGPDRWLAPVCDAFGAAHLGAGLIGATGLLVLVRQTARLSSRVLRLGAATGAALVAGTFVMFAYPACLHSPFAGVDPLVRDLWLSHVGESLSLPAFLQKHPMIGTAIVAPAVMGTLGSFAAAASTGGTTQLRFVLVAVLSAFGVALSFWQVRVLASVTPLALCGGIYLAIRFGAWLRPRDLLLAARLAPVAVLPFTSTIWALTLPKDGSASRDRTAACLSPEALAPLGDLPAGSAVAPINSGSHLLKDTKVSVFAAPYHRNNDGNRFAFDALMALPEQAREMLAERKVNYVIICPGMISMDRLAGRAPQGLAAQLAVDNVPNYLRKRAMGGTPYRVYEVVRRQ